MKLASIRPNMITRSLSLLAAFGMTLTSVPLSAQSAGSDPNNENQGSQQLNPTSEDCCECYTWNVEGDPGEANTSAPGLPPNEEGGYRAYVNLDKNTNPDCEGLLRITAVAYVVRDNKILYETAVWKVAYIGTGNDPATGTIKTENHKQIIFDLDSDIALKGDVWLFETSCVWVTNFEEEQGFVSDEEYQLEGSNEGCSQIHVPLEVCEACTCVDAQNRSFRMTFGTNASMGGMTRGSLIYHAKNFGNPGRAAIMDNLPSNFIVARDGNGLITSVDTGRV